jgi:ribose transport system ATP-binding protein
MNKPLLLMDGIYKSFSGVTVLNNVHLDINKAEVHALVGENGAGKSTLMKILTGIHQKDKGSIFLSDESGSLKQIEINSPRQAQSLGINMVFQELNLLDNLSIAENIYLGREPLRGKLIDWGKLMEDASKAIQEVALNIDPHTKVGELSLAQKQTVEIAKCLSFKSKLIILDEPTTSLTNRETVILFDLLSKLKAKGVSVIYISHRMEEIFTISDRMTVFRDGKYVKTLQTQDASRDEIVKLMVGRELKIERDITAQQKNEKGETCLEVKNLNTRKLLKNINFELRRGEILGFFGLVGAGRTELARAIFGIDKIESGELFIHGRKTKIKTPIDAIKNEIGLVPEDRKQMGLILGLDIKNNMVLAKLKSLRFIRYGCNKENEIAETFIKQLSIAAMGPKQWAKELSGGNQQKIVIGKWLALSPKILILDEPTRGIDVGAKSEIYDLMRKLAKQGMSIIMISSELPEILNVSDRVMVMHEGRITLDAPIHTMDQEKIMHAAVGEVIK